jgi:hypothetical protein
MLFTATASLLLWLVHDFSIGLAREKTKKKKKTNEVSSHVYGLLRAHLVKCINHLEEE